MTTTYFISDLHLGHKNITKHRDEYKEKYSFNTLDEHDEMVIQRIQETVGKRDILWVLGDVCFDKDKLHLLNEINCTKHLVLGNHCTKYLHVKDLLPYFKSIHSMVKHKSGMWLSHAPIHPEELRGRFNIHGYIHGSKLFDQKWKYYNVSLENINFKPISIDEVRNGIWNNFSDYYQDILIESNVSLKDIFDSNGMNIFKVQKMLNRKLGV